MPPVTVLLRTWNAGADMPPLLVSLERQALRPLEILVVDSGSTDGTLDRVRAAGARVVELPHEQFTHAVSTNLGFREARGEIVAMLSQDALPQDPSWLSNLVAPLESPAVAAVFGRQVARNGCFPLERWELERAYPSHGEPGVPYSNVNSAARRSDWETVPYDESVRIAEDRIWARTLSEAGRKIVYAPDAAVIHSHRYTLRQVYDRCREEARSRRATEGERQGLGLLLKAWPRQTLRDARRLSREGRRSTVPYAAAYRFAQFSGMMAGGR